MRLPLVLVCGFPTVLQLERKGIELFRMLSSAHEEILRMYLAPAHPMAAVYRRMHTV